MRLDELKLVSIATDLEFAMFESDGVKYRVWFKPKPNLYTIATSAFEIKSEWWQELDPITAQAVLYEIIYRNANAQ